MVVGLAHDLPCALILHALSSLSPDSAFFKRESNPAETITPQSLPYSLLGPSQPLAPNRPPVVLVPPALQQAGSWFFYQSALRRAAYNQLHYFEYSCREASFMQTGRRLALFLESLVAACPEKRVILIGASLGGLVARAALTCLERPETVAGLITLACPQQGSRLAAYAPKRIFPLLAGIDYRSPAILENVVFPPQLGLLVSGRINGLRPSWRRSPRRLSEGRSGGGLY